MLSSFLGAWEVHSLELGANGCCMLKQCHFCLKLGECLQEISIADQADLKCDVQKGKLCDLPSLPTCWTLPWGSLPRTCLCSFYEGAPAQRRDISMLGHEGSIIGN